MALSNNTSLALLSHDLIAAVPRFIRNAGAFALTYMPDQLDNFLAQVRAPGSFVASKTATMSNASISPPASLSPTGSAAFWSAYSSAKSAAATATASAETGAAAAQQATGWLPGFMHGMGVQNMNSLDGVFSYFASRWAISTFLIAIILNRARVYSASRRRLHLNWQTRLTLRIVPILLFIGQLHKVLQTMHCQTGAALPITANATEKAWNGHFTREGGPLHSLSSMLLFGQSEHASCVSAGLISPNHESPVGSSSILWPLFLCLCLSHLIETISCALEGRHPVPETAMTLFEHSLAFAEAEAVVRNSVGLGLFGPLKSAASSDFINFTRSMVLQRLNVPPEVLLIALISSCSHLSNHILGVFGLQSRCRLVNTTIWGTSFIVAFLWSFIRYTTSVTGADVGVLRYPTICIIGFVPHIVILASIIVCAAIYSISLLVTLLSPPTSGLMRTSLKERLSLARDNLQASVTISNIHMRWSDEFYTTLLKVGFNVLTAASEAVYFNEGISIAISRSTWLENQRIDHIAATYPFRGQLRPQVTVPAGIEGALDIAEGLDLVDSVVQPNPDGSAVSGYARERKTAKVSRNPGMAATREDGVGGSQRSGRWYMSWNLVKQDVLLLVRILAKIVVKCLSKFAPWLLTEAMVEFANPSEARLQKLRREKEASRPGRIDFWVKEADGRVKVTADSDGVDVEAEMKKRMGDEGLSEYLYNWWKLGGTWGEVDASGDYTPGEDNDDLTSIISDSDAGLAGDPWETDSEGAAGQRTPTQSHPFGRSRESSLAPENLLSSLTRLLDPHTIEEKLEARLLASRLDKKGPLTRSQYARERSRANIRLLTGGSHQDLKNQPLTSEEEEEVFEKLIMARRAEANASSQRETRSWDEGGEGFGAGGPQCVVCQCEPRTILVWPCRCLCLCEECRVTLALNNFATCVTCRRDVAAFSRLFVP